MLHTSPIPSSYLIVSFVYGEYMDSYKYTVKGIFSDETKAKEAFFTMYVETILNRNVYCSFKTTDMLVYVDDLVRAVQHTWDVMIPAYTNHSVSDIQIIESDLYRKFIKFCKQSEEYSAKMKMNHT